MPEILTKHPDVAKQVLTSQGARCGAGATPRILTRCPEEGFCALEGGELCVYGPGELGQMTQLSRAELCGASAATAAPSAVGSLGTGLVLAVALSASAAGFAVGRLRRSNRRRYSHAR